MQRKSFLSSAILAGLSFRGAAGVTRVADVVVPERFTAYIQQFTAERTPLIRSGALVANPLLDNFLASGGLTINVPSTQDLDDDAENVSTDDPSSDSTPNKMGSGTEIAVRLSRNNSWSSMDLASDLAGINAGERIAARVGNYWLRRLQAAWLATWAGVFADNDAAPAGSEHVQGDLTLDITGAYSAGVTDFNTASFIDAVSLMGDAEDGLALMMAHSVVYARMKKNNLIDFIPDARGEVEIPTFQGLEVIVSDKMPVSTNDYDTYIFGRGVTQLGTGTPQVPTEIDRKASAGNGSGQEVLHSRLEWCIHPTGHAYAGTPPSGGPSNFATANNLANAASWQRVYPERKQINVVRLRTTEA